MAIFLTGFSPTGQFVNPQFLTISFSLTSDGDPIDASSVDVKIAGDPDGTEDVDFAFAIEGGVFQDGYVGSQIIDTVDGNPGYAYTIIPSNIHRNRTMAVEIEVDTSPSSGGETFIQYFSTATHSGVFSDISPLVGTNPQPDDEPFVGLTFSGKNNNVLFQLNDSSEPIITNRIPVPNSTSAAVTTNIQFSLHDSGKEGVNIATLDVYVAGVQAIVSGNFIVPFTGSISAGVIDGFDGFIIVIDPATNFNFSQLVEVRVVVEDLVSDPSAINTLDTTYSFTTTPLVDTEGAGVTSTLPPTGLGLDACIEFDWLDQPQGGGPDINTLDVDLRRELTVDCITSIQQDAAVRDGVAQPGYELFFFAIEVGLQIGYHIIICPEVPFNELETITVIINGEDTAGNPTAVQFFVSTLETTPPTILNFNPDDGDTGIDPEVAIVFEMHDFSGVGVDPDRLTMRVDNGEAIIEGVVQPGFDLEIIPTTVVDEFTREFDGYQFSLTRSIPFTPASNIGVEIDGYDGYGNFTNAVYNFTIAPDITPPTVVFDPPNGTTGVNRDQIITVDITDAVGVDKDSVNITVQGNQAVLDGVAVAPFDVTISNIITNPPFIDGYRYTIDTELDFTFNTLINTNVIAKDLSGNENNINSIFRTFSDDEGPAITDITPRDGQLEVSLRPEVTFTIRDAYDVAFELTSMDIGDSPVIRNGLVQSGFSFNVTRIDGGTLGIPPGDGYSVIVTPNEDYPYDHTTTVSITGYDRSQNNATTETATWTTVNPRPPIFDIIPDDGETDIPVDTNFVFEVFSDGYKVDINTLNVLIDGNPAIVNNVVQSPDFVGTVDTILDGYHYRGEIDPRFLLTGLSTHSIDVSAEEPLSGNIGQSRSVFVTGSDPLNPETIYIGDADGVKSKLVDQVAVNVNADVLVDGYYVLDLQAKSLVQINRLLVGTRDHGAFIYPTNYDIPTLFYSIGDEITKVHISEANNGTIYLANRSRNRVDVYYNILYDDVGRSTPDVYYGAPDGYTDGYAVPGMLDGYFTDMVVDENSSTVAPNSVRIFLGTPVGAMRIDTDESDITHTEINGVLTTYGIVDTGYDFEILSGTTNQVVALDVNSRLNYLYVATRSEDANDTNAVTYIDLADNSFRGHIPEDRLIDRLINDIDFGDK